MSTMQDAIQLSQQLTALHFAFQQVHETLQLERDCLAKNRIHELKEISEIKNNQLTTLETAIAPLQTLLTSSDPDSELLNTIRILSSTDQTRLNSLWQETKKLFNQTQSQNEINGTVIAINLHNTNRLIQFLRTGNAVADSYDGSGKATHTKVNTDFVEA